MSYQELATQLDRIEAELHRLGFKTNVPTEPRAVNAAFGGAEMAFEEWLVQVFLPAARKAIAAHQLPQRSQVGVAALRHWDGQDEMEQLVVLLSQFDRAVERMAGAGQRGTGSSG